MFFRRKKSADKPAAEAQSGGEAKADGTTPSGQEPLAASSGAPGRSPAPSTQFLTGEAGKDRRTVQVLLETIQRVSMSRDLESLLTYVVDSSIRLTGAERGLLILRGSDEKGLSVRTARLLGEKPLASDVRFSTSVAIKVLEEGQPIRATVHSESEALELGKSVYDLKLRAVLCVPLKGASGDEQDGDPPGGVLYVDSRAATRQFTQGDLALFAALAQQISIAMDNARLHLDSIEKVRLEQSIELVSVIQRDLMPEVPSGLQGWDVHGWYRPAEDAAGDFYDFVKVRDGRWAVVVGDATGHGIGPALISAASQGSLRAYLRMSSDLGQVITLLNQDLCERVEDGRFLTLYLALLTPDGTVDGLNAGHAFPFLWRAATGEVEELGAGGGPALGMIPDEEFVAHPALNAAPGDVLLIYTDGLSEARDPREPEVLFEEEGIRRALCEAASAGKDAKDITLHLVAEAMKFSGDAREDDITIVVARRSGEG